ncbi:MAG: ABC transporter ATP-binding protein [Planctomycetota bacterium]
MRPLEVEELCVDFGSAPVLEDVGLAVEPGGVVAVLGPSGCGKTTLMRTVCGFVQPRRGRIAVGGVRVCDGERELVPPERRGTGMVFQDYALFAHMTVAQNLAFGVRAESAAARVRELLDFVGLTELAERRPSELSGGQQQRVALARALAPRPALLLLDEPFANLDASLKGRLTRELRALLARAESAALMVTHDREDAFALADRVVILDRTVLQEGTPEAIYRRPATAHVAALTGECSLLSGEARGGGASTVLGDVALVEEERRGPVRICLRPEDLELRPEPDGPLQVIDVRYRGRAFWVELDAGGERLLVEHDRRLAAGTRVAARARRDLWAL